MKDQFNILSHQLDELMLRDKQLLLHRLHIAKKIENCNAQLVILTQLASDIKVARKKLQERIAACPEITYPDNIPIKQKKQDILDALNKNQVVIIAGETGSGKTTQLPKICLEIGRGIKGMIGHTQPRRLAARSVAQRIADELKIPLGSSIGYKVRFTDKVSDYTLVKLMTDGILLAEIQQDRLLMQYDTLIIDEAHERSLNIDFILGYLHELLPKRLDLKVIITSATLDPQKFSCYFNAAPIIEVLGRTYPVLVRYRPIVTNENNTECDQLQSIVNAINELKHEEPGDILIFMSGEREIKDTANALHRLNLPHTEIVPLYARLSNSEQNQVFQSHHSHRIILATNVAETSITVPGIKYVIDTGIVRISRYNSRNKVQRLPLEPISQASANQRKGRCGRLSEGICIRLYSEQEFLSRAIFTDPEILRTNLASVILKMTSLGLGNIASFPFLDTPNKRNIQDGIQLLEELGAINKTINNTHYTLTPQGSQLAKFPIDPRLARMVLEATKNGSLNEIMIITAALSIHDPRERPINKQQESNEKHCRFVNKDSDFLTFINLWSYLQKQQQIYSCSKFRRMCKKDFINYRRVLEWQDVYTQLQKVVQNLHLPINRLPSNYRSIHSAILVGFLSHIGQKDAENKVFIGTHNTRFSVFPSSCLFKKSPKWIIVAELIETNRLWGRICARIEPEWIELLAPHIVKHSYSNPHWSQTQGKVVGSEKLMIFNLTLIASRPINYSRIDPPLCRELFIRHALIDGNWKTQHLFFHDNHKLRYEVEELEHKLRRRDILVDSETLFRFYEKCIPHHVVSGMHFDQWWECARKQQPNLLNIKKEMLIKDSVKEISHLDYPDFWYQGNLKLRLTYQFEPGANSDGVTVHIPLSIIHQVKEQDFTWNIPVMRHELVIALIKSLPKSLRRNFIPLLNYAEAFLSRVTALSVPLLDSLEYELHRMSGVLVSRNDWQWKKVPPYLKMTFKVVDEKKQALCEGKDLTAIKLLLQGKVQAIPSEDIDKDITQRNLHIWNFGTLPAYYEQQRSGYSIKVYPALVDEKDSISIRLFNSEKEQHRAMWQGTRRLLLLTIPPPIKYLYEKVSKNAKLRSYFHPYASVIDLIEDCISCSIDKLILKNGGPVWEEEQFACLHTKVRAELNETVLETVNQTEQILESAHKIHQNLKGRIDISMALALSDIKNQMNRLVYRGSITVHSWKQLPYTLRYLQAIEYRMEQLAINSNQDRIHMLKVWQVQRILQEWTKRLPRVDQQDDEVKALRWMIEELRVSLFAQHLCISSPISEKLIFQTIDQFSQKLGNLL